MTTLNNVIEFIIKNSDKTERMDRINKITFPFTSKYNSRFKKSEFEKALERTKAIEDDYWELVKSPLGTFPNENNPKEKI